MSNIYKSNLRLLAYIETLGGNMINTASSKKMNSLAGDNLIIVNLSESRNKSKLVLFTEV